MTPYHMIVSVTQSLTGIEIVPAPYTLRTTGHVVDFGRRMVTDGSGAVVRLTAAEYTALVYLLEHRGHVVSREALFMHVLRRPWRPEDRCVDQVIHCARKKLGLGTACIQSVRGLGYIMPQEV